MKKKILLIDDDEELCEEMSEILRGQGYEIQTALDGRRGWDLIRRDHFDVVLLDIKLPAMDGVEVLMNIKTLKGERTKVIVVSASPAIDRLLDSESDMGKTGYKDLMALADGLISKPHDIDLLLNQIKKLLS